MASVKENLIAAQALIRPTKNWCVGAYGLTKDGRSTYGDDPEACMFCGNGAIERVTGDPNTMSPTRQALNAACQRLYGHTTSTGRIGTVSVNDDLGHAALMAAYDDAIAHEDNPSAASA